MSRNVRLLFASSVFDAVNKHLFRGDGLEHAGALLCGWHERAGRLVLTARQFIPARDGVDFTTTPESHGRLQPLFIEDALSQAKESQLAYVAIHNHFATDSVTFSDVAKGDAHTSLLDCDFVFLAADTAEARLRQR